MFLQVHSELDAIMTWPLTMTDTDGCVLKLDEAVMTATGVDHLSSDMGNKGQAERVGKYTITICSQNI